MRLERLLRVIKHLLANRGGDCRTARARTVPELFPGELC
jgi:hypothetical protein